MNFIDVFHRIVDLPVVAYILEFDTTKHPLPKDPNGYLEISIELTNYRLSE
jgi:hypothetical protein